MNIRLLRAIITTPPLSNRPPSSLCTFRMRIREAAWLRITHYRGCLGYPTALSPYPCELSPRPPKTFVSGLVSVGFRVSPEFGGLAVLALKLTRLGSYIRLPGSAYTVFPIRCELQPYRQLPVFDSDINRSPRYAGGSRRGAYRTSADHPVPLRNPSYSVYAGWVDG